MHTLRRIAAGIAASLFLMRCASETTPMENTHAHTNALIHERSPYLRQHAHNPVDWMPWGEAAFEKARKENKLIIVSVGYAACHWCHVMERETFEDSTAAALMNAHFVSVKVDREERPDVDQIYMDAVQLMTGQGGWPLNCVTLPDGRPIWGGTYFPRDRWISILSQLRDLWRDNPGEAFRYGDSMMEAVQSMDSLERSGDARPFQEEDLQAILQPWRGAFDTIEGGPNRAPKFPLPSNYLFLMRAHHFTGDQRVGDNVDLTLRKMAWGGIYDQLGGGFARYSVDRYWRVPHFEKMAYDNGQLLSLYAEAYRRKPDPLYKRIIEETTTWLARELMSPEGGFYSSLDADSEGEEGKFYVWTRGELDTLLGPDATWFSEYYSVTLPGNWEHGINVLCLNSSPEEFAARKGWSLPDFEAKLSAAKAKLMAARDQRIRPGLDDKILSSWNALALKGLVDAYRSLGDRRYLELALRNAAFIERHMTDGDRLWRSHQGGKSGINAFLDDYALLADAYLALHQATLDPRWLHRASALADYAITHFSDPATGMFFYTSDLDPKLISRKTEVHDNVIPASNSVMAHVLSQLGHLLGERTYAERSLQMLWNVRKDMPRYGSGHSHWAMLMLQHIYPYHEVVVAGPDAHTYLRQLDQHYLPNVLFTGATAESEGQAPLLDHRFVEGKTRIYVCQDQVCQLPVESVEPALRQLGVK